MATTTILALGITTATSSDVVVAAGGIASIGIFVASGSIPYGESLQVMQKTPGGDALIGNLDNETKSVVVNGPGTYRVVRNGSPNWPVPIGAYSET